MLNIQFGSWSLPKTSIRTLVTTRTVPRIANELHEPVHTILFTVVIWIAEADWNLTWKFRSTCVLIGSNEGVRWRFLELLRFQFDTSFFRCIQEVFR